MRTIATTVLSMVILSGCGTVSTSPRISDHQESTSQKISATPKTTESDPISVLDDVVLTLMVDIVMDRLFGGLFSDDAAPNPTPQITSATEKVIE